MADHVILLSVPGLRERDLVHMPRLSELTAAGDRAPLVASVPAVTLPVQANMTTGLPPAEHGVVANGFYWRDGSGAHDGVEMWTAWADVVQRPRVWDRLKDHDPSLTSAVWFPLLVKGCAADFVCTPAPKHNADGTESMWCHTRPESLYADLLPELGHFPLQHFWGPMANIQGSRWIVSSLLWLLEREKPNFVYVYLPHLDYAAQKFGPDSPQAVAALGELDAEIGRLVDGAQAALIGAATSDGPLWLVASEYAISDVSHASYPNRALRDAGLLEVRIDDDGRERLDFAASRAWVMVDHQVGHVFVRDRDAATIAQAADVLGKLEGIAEVWDAAEQARQGVGHERSGDLVLISEPHSWQAYYWWRDDALAPCFARQVDIHQKPGYDPCEQFWDMAAMQQHGGGVPLDPQRVKGSHGAPPRSEAQRGVLLSSRKGTFIEQPTADVDLFDMVLRQFGA